MPDNPAAAGRDDRSFQHVELRTGIWHEDRALPLAFPARWEVRCHWPRTPPPLDEAEIRRRLAEPVGQPPLRELARGRRRVGIITDDLSRPTPVHRILPFLLEELSAAGIGRDQVRIVVGTGTHGAQDRASLRRKLGPAADGCEVLVHDDLHHTRRIGKTSFGTPVHVNRDVLECDLLVGIGGVYPQHTTGFGGGGKLALGVLGRRSIVGLHFGHPSMGGRYVVDNDFRRDVTEMAQMMGLKTLYAVHIDAHSRIVNLFAGDYLRYYDEAARFSLEAYRAPLPTGADVVIANAYPLDTSLTFMRKSYKPLAEAPRETMKIIIASAHEGLGHHGLFQHVRPSRLMRVQRLYRRLLAMGPRQAARKVAARVARRLRPAPAPAAPAGGQSPQPKAIPRNTDHLWLYCTSDMAPRLPAVDGMTVLDGWDQVLAAIRGRYPGREDLKVELYPCAPLQTF